MRITLVAVAMAYGCVQTIPPVQPAETDVVDADGDGFDVSVDCDDGDAERNSGATEICDGVDNDCDGPVDEGLESSWYADNDRDGFGDAGSALRDCAQPVGYVPDATDCDDRWADAHPGGTEVCDGYDDDCNGAVDDGVGATWYADGDGDGYGGPDSIFQCAAPPGYTDDGSDCDDTDPASYPGATEVLGDGIDQDCDGAVCQPGPSGMVALWRGDWDTADALGRNDGTGSTSYASGVVRSAMEFTGKDLVAAGSDGLPVSDASRTIELWTRLSTAPSSEAFLAGYGAFGSNGRSFGLGTSKQKLFVSNWGGSVTGSDVSLREWHHVAATAKGSAIKLYLDGVQVGSGTMTLDTSSSTPFYLGSIEGSLGATRALDGRVDEVTVYDRALTSAEIAQIVAIGADGKCSQERCDGVDDDGDGLIDDEDPDVTGTTTFYADIDEDGYGDPASPVQGCEPPDGYVANESDCDDTSAAIRPNGVEIPADGIDNDCDGVVDP